MSRVVQVAWLLPSLWLILFAARVLISDLREPRREDDQQSWTVPQQRRPERISGRY